MDNIVLISITGQDGPNRLSQVCDVLARSGVEILDIGQSVIHSRLNLGILVRMPGNDRPVIKDVLYRAYELGLTASFSPVSPEEYAVWTTVGDRPRYIITLLSRHITAEQIARVAGIAADCGLSVDVVNRLTGRVPLEGETPERACVELTARGVPADGVDAMRARFLGISADLDVDIAVQEDNIYRRSRRLALFDMDSTLIQAEMMDELAREMGVYDEVCAVTERAMRGELDFKESFRERLAKLEGLDAARLDAVWDRIPLTDGAERLMTNLRRLGIKTAIVSGGFTCFAEKLRQRLGMDYMFANELEVKDGRCTGRVSGEIVDSQFKARTLRELAERDGISLQQTIAVGDGANDLPMLTLAGLGIAFHAKPAVREGADHSISTMGLDGILYLIGFRDCDDS